MAYMGFDKLQGELAGKYGKARAGAIAAAVGRKKYGAKAFSHAAATGTSLKGHKVLKKHKKRKIRRVGTR